MSKQKREKKFYDEKWKGVRLRAINEEIIIPGVDLKGKRVLICSCGSGIDPVRAAGQGAETYGFDISETAVGNARAMAEHNNVRVRIEVMDFHNLSYEDDFFDVIYGSAILHHVDCSIVGREIYRVLRPGGTAYFRENSDRNPIYRLIRRSLFGRPGGYQKQRFLFIKRAGTTDEYPLTTREIDILSKIFRGNADVKNNRFDFFYLLYFYVLRNDGIGKLLRAFDAWIGNTFPAIKRFSYTQDILLKKPLVKNP